MDLEATSSTTSEGLDLASRLQGGEQPSSNCSMPVTKIEDTIQPHIGHVTVNSLFHNNDGDLPPRGWFW